MTVSDEEYAAAGVGQAPEELPPEDAGPPPKGEMASAAGARLELDVDMKNADPMVLAVERIGAALKEIAEAGRLKPEPMMLAQHRFRILCMDVLGHLYTDDDATRVADALIMGVYAGHLGFRQLRAYVFDDAKNKLTDQQRHFAFGLCVGFMVDYLPRVRG